MDAEKQTFKALDKIATYLAKRDHSVMELKKKLSSKFPEQNTDAAIAIALEKGWILPPEELAEKVARTLHNKNKGHLYIQNYLRNLGLPSTAEDSELEYEKCITLLDNRFANWQNFTYEEKQKPARFLQGRGFSLSNIKKALYEN